MKNLISKEEKDQIDLICKEYEIENYSINSDGSVDVDGNVKLTGMTISHLPLRFGNVTGYFKCNQNNLTSLSGSPHTVGVYFTCSYNKLTSLEGSPHIVGEDYHCNDNQLTSLVGGPVTVGGNYECSYNRLVTLESSPTTIGGYYICSNNFIKSLVGAPTTIGYNFDCSSNQIVSTYSGDTDIEVENSINFKSNRLPSVLITNLIHIKLILKYQRHFFIWNDDLTLNEENFKDLITEIEDGLL